MKKSWSGVWFCVVSLSFMTPSQTGCANESVVRISRVGKLQMSLEGTSTTGVTYRLRSGTFQISGAAAASLSTEDDLAAKVLSIDLEAGQYSVELLPGWFLERAEPDGGFASVDAVLTSSNPVAFVIQEQQTTNVGFRFMVQGVPVEIGKGTLEVSIAIDDQPQAGCPGSTPSNPKMFAEFAAANPQADRVDAMLEVDPARTAFLVATRQVGAQCGGGTPAAIWRATVDPNGGPAQVTHVADLPQIQEVRSRLFRSTIDGTLFTGGGWCGYKPPYYSVDNGSTWQSADSGSVHPPNSTFSFVDFQGSTYAGTGYDPSDGQVYRWLGAGNWQLMFDQASPRTMISALQVFDSRLFVGSSVTGASCQSTVPVYVSDDATNFQPTSGMDPCATVLRLMTLGGSFYAWTQVWPTTTMHLYRWDGTQSWQLLSSADISNVGPAQATSTNDTFYAAAQSLGGGSEGVYATKDFGVTWQLVVATPVPSLLTAIGNVLYWSTPAGTQPPRLYCLPI